MNDVKTIVYEGAVRLDVKFDGKTVWLSQQQIAELFGVGQAAISKHLKNLYASGELEADGTYSILEYMVGNRVYSTRFYNLDVIISVGYRVNSVQATHFRRWATTKLREIMLAELVRKVKYKRLEDRVGKVEDGLAELREGVCAVLKQLFESDTPPKRNKIGFSPESDNAGKTADGEQGETP